MRLEKDSIEVIALIDTNISDLVQGITLYELFVTVDYTAAASGYSHDIMGLAAASIGKVNSLATANVGKISGT